MRNTGRLFTMLATGLCLSAQSAESPRPHAAPKNTGGWVVNQDVSDEFNGNELDTDKWHVQGTNGEYHNRFMGRAPSQFTPRNVSVDRGFLKITTRWEPDFPFADKAMDGHKYANITTGAVITKSEFLYGYLETRCKAADGPISSSFWSTGKGGELDVFEHWGRNPRKPSADRRYHTSLHDWRNPESDRYGKRIWTNDHLLDFRVAEDFHTYAVEWAPDYLRIFVDGRQIRFVTRQEIGNAWVLVNPQKVWLDCESFPWEVHPSKLTASDYPGDGLDFVVDYVRIWQREGREAQGDAEENLLANPGFESGSGGWTVTGGAAVVTEGSLDGVNAVKLSGRGRAEQTVAVRPDTTYVLSAWIKVPSTNMKNIWQNAWLGAEGYGAGEVRKQFFRPDYYRGSIQFRTGPNATTAKAFFTNDHSGHTAYADRFELYEAPVLGGK